MAFRMQTSVPEIMNTDGEPEYIYEMYGEDSKKPGTYAANCLLARRLVEKDVKFIRLWFTDILGQVKSFAITDSELEEALDKLEKTF